MNKENFDKRKQELLLLIEETLSPDSKYIEEKESLMELRKLLNQYTYENRLSKKGLLSHAIIDSLQLDYSFGEKFINFDNTI